MRRIIYAHLLAIALFLGAYTLVEGQSGPYSAQIQAALRSITAGSVNVPVGSITGLGTGVATWLATPSTANFFSAVTGETGSGAVVGATSPTLVTPILGAATVSTVTHTPQAVDVNGATTFAITSDHVVLTCDGAETIQTITGGAHGMLLVIEHGDTDCTLDDDDDATAANAIDLTGADTDDVGAVNKVTVLVRGASYWKQVGESDN